MDAPPQGRTVEACRRAVAPAVARYVDRLAHCRRVSCARHEVSAQRGGLRHGVTLMRHAPPRTLSGHASGLAAAVRRKSPAAQGPAGGRADSTLAGRCHDAEEPHPVASREAFHRLCARSGEATRKQEEGAVADQSRSAFFENPGFKTRRPKYIRRNSPSFLTNWW